MTLLLGVGVALFQPSHPVVGTKGSEPPIVVAKTGTAVSDLQALDKNADLFANFDALDDVKDQ